MKLKVERRFRDKNTGDLYEVNSVIEVTQARGEELLADERNLVTQIKEPAKANKPKATPKTKNKKSGK